MKHLSLFALSAAALLLTSCATSTLWEKTNPREYLVIKWSPEAETRVQRRNVDYRVDLERGVMFVEKSDFRKTHDYLTRFFVTPIAVGGGKQSLPDKVRLELELLDEHRFGNGVVHLHYRTGT